LKLSRRSGAVSAYGSYDGAIWILIGTTPLDGSVLAGAVVTSHDPLQLDTATFDALELTASGGSPAGSTGGVPSPWASQDVGSVGVPGSAASADGSIFSVAGAGADIWGSGDAFQFVSQPLAADVTVVARVSSMENTNTYAKAGLMLRESADPDAANVILDLRPDGSIEFMARTTTGEATSFYSGGYQPFPTWLMLVRMGSTVSGYVSIDGSMWNQVGTISVDLPPTVLGGLVVTSHDPSLTNTATFDNVSATSTGSGTP
jgi:hypothetical protein